MRKEYKVPQIEVIQFNSELMQSGMGLHHGSGGGGSFDDPTDIW